MDKIKSLIDIIDYYGETNQKTKAIEEMAELIKAICKNDIENIEEEIADVSIMLSQLQIIYGFSNDKIEKIKKEKINRTLERIKDRKKEFESILVKK